MHFFSVGAQLKKHLQADGVLPPSVRVFEAPELDVTALYNFCPFVAVAYGGDSVTRASNSGSSVSINQTWLVSFGHRVTSLPINSVSIYDEIGPTIDAIQSALCGFRPYARSFLMRKNMAVPVIHPEHRMFLYTIPFDVIHSIPYEAY